MSITKSRLQQIIKEEISRVAEGYGSSGPGGRGYRYGGGDTTGYKGSYNDTPWYRAGGSGRMSDAEARERGGRGYDEPSEAEGPRGPRGGMVHSTVTIYTDPEQATDKFNANLGPRLNKTADVFIGMSGYDGIVGNLVTGKNPQTGFNNIGSRWVLAKSSDGGYTFRVGTVIGGGSSPSEALIDAAHQGFEGSDVVLSAMGIERDEFYADDKGEHERVPGGEQYAASMDDMDPIDEGDAEYEQMNESARSVVGRWNKLAGTLKG
jgi:hypothetical protein